MQIVASSSSIPVIDMSPLILRNNPADCHKVISAISTAVLSHGIFAVTGHGVPPDVMAAALAVSKDTLRKGGPAESEHWHELEERASTRLPGELNNFTPSGVEQIGRMYTGKASAPVEFIAKLSVFPPRRDSDPSVLERQRNLWPATANGNILRRTLESYFAEMQRVSDALHCALALSLGKPANFIEDALAPYVDGVLRAQRYQRDERAEDTEPAMAAHKDLGTTTLLLSDAPGLQFQPRNSDDWVDVIVPEGALVVNLGEFFEIWTHGAWRATPHRVSASAREGRTSLAFFSNQSIPLPLDGSTPEDRTIAPLEGLPSGEEPDGSQPEWTGIQTQFASNARKSVAWPSFLFERLRNFWQGEESAHIDVGPAYKGGA
jgi:isopenicillin N synthase-like dioxygenase